jgi:hypothetical protein
VACGSLVATGLGSDAGLESLDQVMEFLGAADPVAAGRIGGHAQAAAVKEQAR